MAQLSPLLHFSFPLQQGRTSFSSTVSFSLMCILPNTGQPTKYIQSCCPKGVWDQIAYWERAVVCSVPGRLGPIPSRVLGLSRSKLFSEGVLAVRYFWFLHSAVWAYVMAVLATSIGMTSFFFSYCFQKFACHYIQNYHFFLSRVSSYTALSAPSAVLDNCPLLLCASPLFSAAVHHPSLAIIRWVKTDLSI